MGSTRKTRTLEDRVRLYLQRRGVPGGARVLVAFSGGPDSRALVTILRELADSYPLEVSAAYLDHGLRSADERREELEFVRRCCTGLGMTLVEGSLPPGSLAAGARRLGRSLEEAARVERYRFLRSTLRATGGGYLAVGHNLDDHLETLVMRFFQGSGVAGLRGIPKSRGVLLRPLREVPRGDILAWLEQRGLGYCVDSTNRDPSFLRNSVRHRLLPVVAELFPGFSGALERFARTMGGVHRLVGALERERLQWRRETRGWSIGFEELFAVPYLVRLRSIHERIDRWGNEFRRVPHRFFAALREPEGLGGRTVLLAGHGMILRRRGGRLFLERHVVGGRKKGYFIRVRGGCEARIPEAGLGVSWSRGAGAAGGSTERLDDGDPGAAGPAEVGLPGGALVFRSFHAGDRIRTRDGFKPVRKLFGEWNIPYSERWKVPIVDSGEGILAVLGAPLGYSDRFSPGMSDRLRSLLARAVEVR